MEQKMNVYDLVRLMAVLRSPEGCPWDRAQRVADLRPYIMEEALELVEAVDSADNDKIREELGDLLFEIIFVARIMEEQGVFSLDDAADSIGRKMVERHPHVFGKDRLSTPGEVEENWTRIKARRNPDDSALSGVTEELPALVIAHKYGQRAAGVGFDWDDIGGVTAKLSEEIGELQRAVSSGDRSQTEDEIGDILFTVANLARFLGVHPELALRKTNRKFRRRFQNMERSVRSTGRSLTDMTLEELEALWNEAKQADRGRRG
ncbi:MAG: nucleoside triphosphate pyrophosphohydrolase [Candidatus Dadabacteria bacterium]|nr:nucleoside triphosphate pyrophosphohydrolase [Candidatus Dadabacteria bacterium]